MEPGGEGVEGLPREFLFDFAAIDGVAEIVAGAVVDVGNEGKEGLRILVCDTGEFMDDAMQEVDIFLLAAAADVVNLAGDGFGENGPDGCGVIVDKNPIADVVPFAIDGELLFVEAAIDHAGNKFFDVLAGAVIVGAVRNGGGKIVGVMVGADEVVGGGLRG